MANLIQNIRFICNRLKNSPSNDGRTDKKLEQNKIRKVEDNWDNFFKNDL